MDGGSERAGACERALTQTRTPLGGGALEIGDLRLLEDGSERVGALVSDTVATDTARGVRGGYSARAGVSRGADTKGILLGGGAPQGGYLCLLEDGSERGGALVSDVVAPDTARDGCGGTVRGQVRVSGR